MGTIIKVENLVKRFGGVTAVDDISFEVEEGTIFGFLGPNGAGKSSAATILANHVILLRRRHVPRCGDL